jgi:hypothetical protein
MTWKIPDNKDLFDTPNPAHKFIVRFYRKALPHEIGPVAEDETVVAASKSKVEKWGKSIARERGWRFMGVKRA